MTGSALPDWRDSLPWPGPETHKHIRGRLGVVSGRAAHESGAGDGGTTSPLGPGMAPAMTVISPSPETGTRGICASHSIS